MSDTRTATRGHGSLYELCWQHGKASRLGVLVDGSNYFAALREALLKARRSIYILGWDIDSRTRLVGEDIPPADGAPELLRDFLAELVRRNRRLQVKLLLWDWSMLLAAERELLPQVSLGWQTPRRVDICLDGELPFGASHHHKLVVVDDRLAFIGGLDLTIRRWDTPAHEPDNEQRVDPDGQPYPPFHDLHAVVDGAPAQAIASFCRPRWEQAAGEHLEPADLDTDPWPGCVTPQFTDLDTGVARTVARYCGEGEIREIEAVYVAAIRAAERFIYIENQYVTAGVVAEALIERLHDNPRLQVLFVCPRAPGGWLEASTMGASRERIMARIAEAGVDDRVRFVEPVVKAGDDEQAVMVHAKLMIVDDCVLLMGSANLNNRSLGFDTECNLVLDCAAPVHRQAARELRARLLAEHTGAAPEQVDALLENDGDCLDALQALGDGRRRLSPIERDPSIDTELLGPLTAVADPEAPLDPQTLLGDSFGGRSVSVLRQRAVRIAGALLLLGALLATWRYTPLSALVDAEFIAERLADTRNDTRTTLLMLGLFVGGGLVFFPVTVLIAAAAIVLGPTLGFATALAGTLLSATVSFLAGLQLEGVLRSLIPGAVRRKIRSAMKDNGIMAVAVMRNVPVAPFTAVNLLAGQTGIRLPGFLLGTLLGMAPGIAMLCIMGDRVRAILTDPTPGNVAWLVTAVVAWVAVIFLLQKLANRFKS